ncbi:MAG TPA: hypothetical protein VEQ63_01805, partial [Bryobacteraceae bacterium]|nr:hypothetical protein [Bryobacteraceae bacterium]
NLASFEKAIVSAKNIDDCWDTILKVQETFGFSAARLNANGRLYESWGLHVRAPKYWTMQIPLSDNGDYIELARDFGSSVLPMVVVPFVDLLAASLSDKLKDQTIPDAVVSPKTARDAAIG